MEFCINENGSTFPLNYKIYRKKRLPYLITVNAYRKMSICFLLKTVSLWKKKKERKGIVRAIKNSTCALVSFLKLHSSPQITRNLSFKKVKNIGNSQISCLEEPLRNKITFVQKGSKEGNTVNTYYCFGRLRMILHHHKKPTK